MKKIIYLVLVLFSIQLYAQESSLKEGVSNYVQREDKLILNLTSDGWSGLPSQFTHKAIRSRGFSFLLMNERMNKTGTFGLGLGLGFMSQNVHSDATIMDTTFDESSSSLIKIPDSLNYDLNKLSLNFINAALELRFRSKLNKHNERFKL